MSRLTVGLWKEARDQRGIAIALLVALPVLALPAAWAFGDQLPRHAFADGAPGDGHGAGGGGEERALQLHAGRGAHGR